MVHVFEGFFLSQIIFTTVRFASKFSVYILSLLLLTFKRLTGKYNGMGSKILQKFWGRKQIFLLLLGTRNSQKSLLHSSCHLPRVVFTTFEGKKLLSDLACLLALQFLNLFVCLFFQVFFEENSSETYFFFSLSLKQQKVVMLVKTFKNVTTIFNSKLVHGVVKMMSL